MSETRKLAAILVADVVGYSRLAGADEDRTLAPSGSTQRPHRPGHRRSSRPYCETHRRWKHYRVPPRGRRRPLRNRGAKRPHRAQRRRAGRAGIEFRLGIHLGDVVDGRRRQHRNQTVGSNTHCNPGSIAYPAIASIVCHRVHRLILRPRLFRLFLATWPCPVDAWRAQGTHRLRSLARKAVQFYWRDMSHRGESRRVST
jgi:class 3 adenylate cyclase